MEKSILSDEDLIYDGGEHAISCSNCRKPLTTIVISRPNNKLETTLTVECPYCHDKSFKKKIRGVYFIGPTEDGKLDIVDLQMINSSQKDDILIQEIFVKTVQL